MRLRKEPVYIHELDTAEGQLGGKFYDYNAPAHSGLARRFVGKKKKMLCKFDNPLCATLTCNNQKSYLFDSLEWK